MHRSCSCSFSYNYYHCWVVCWPRIDSLLAVHVYKLKGSSEEVCTGYRGRYVYSYSASMHMRIMHCIRRAMACEYDRFQASARLIITCYKDAHRCRRRLVRMRQDGISEPCACRAWVYPGTTLPVPAAVPGPLLSRSAAAAETSTPVGPRPGIAVSEGFKAA